jgi:hypothetical protein
LFQGRCRSEPDHGGAPPTRPYEYFPNKAAIVHTLLDRRSNRRGRAAGGGRALKDRRNDALARFAKDPSIADVFDRVPRT